MSKQQIFDRRDIRRLNTGSVLKQLQRHGQLSRAAIAHKLGLTRATVSNIVAELLEAGVVTETSYTEGGSGRPGLLLDFNPGFGSMIAVHLDIDQSCVVLTDANQTRLWELTLPLSVEQDPMDILENVATLIDQALACSLEHGLRCLGIAVAWSGLVDRRQGELVFGPTSGWSQVHIKALWEQRFETTVFVENEAHAGAVGVLQGDEPSAENMIYLSLGAGLAAGVFAEGELLRGTRGFAGQVGHTTFRENDIACNCGKIGCWATEVTSGSLFRKLEESGISLTHNAFDDDKTIRVFNMATKGDEVVLQVLRTIGRDVGRGLGRLVQCFNPSSVVIGGRMAPLLRLVESSIREGLEEETLPFMGEGVSIRISTSGRDAINGCLSTVFEAAIENPVRLASPNP